MMRLHETRAVEAFARAYLEYEQAKEREKDEIFPVYRVLAARNLRHWSEKTGCWVVPEEELKEAIRLH